MSFQAMKDVWACRIENPMAKYVLLAIANYANDSGKAWPSIARLANDTGTCEKTVRVAVAWLIEKGHLKRDKHNGKIDTLHLVDAGSGYRTPRYELPDTPVAATDEPIIEPINKRTPYSPPPGDNAQLKNGELKKQEPQNIANGYPPDFERLWQHFPRNPNSSKQLAYKRWRKLSQSDREDCEDTTPLYQAELDKLKPGKDGRKPVMHLSTYISQAMWENYINGQVQENPGLFGNGAGRHHSH